MNNLQQHKTKILKDLKEQFGVKDFGSGYHRWFVDAPLGELTKFIDKAIDQTADITYENVKVEKIQEESPLVKGTSIDGFNMAVSELQSNYNKFKDGDVRNNQ